MSIKKLDIKQLDHIIKNAIQSIEESQSQIFDIQEYAEKEHKQIEKEIEKLKFQILNTLELSDEYQRKLRLSKMHLLKINKNHGEYTEQEMKEAYEDADYYRVQLAIYQEREQMLIQKRNGMEIQLISLSKITQKAQHLNQNVGIAMDILTGDLKNIANHIGDLYTSQLLGMKILHAQEEERQRISREIHDGPAQSMSHILLKSELCLKLLDKDTDQTKEELTELRDMIKFNMEDIRRIIYDLRPMILDDLGLIPALERHIEQVQEESGLDISFEGEVSAFKLAPDIGLTLFRVTQEALRNIVKHAKATKVEVRLSFLKDYIELFIKDDGVGFNMAEIESRQGEHAGFGISAMRERVMLLQGKFEIRSQIGGGTRCYATIPLHIGQEEE
ncbi:MAG: sensor histidine kinase [Epulopiscium sp.]|nr:sensor histidine kinase [Candidatus Epulonipiscium sp.]